MTKVSPTRRCAAAGLLLAVGIASGTAQAYTAPYSAPEGITLVNVMKTMDDAIPQYLWRRLGDATGKPLYTSDADQSGASSCAAECAKEFPPYLAGPQAKALGDFTLVSRSDGGKQWAYQGKPLYRYSGTDPAGQPVGARFALKEDPKWADPASDVFSPKASWRRAAYMPDQTAVMPGTVELDDLAIAGGFGFVDATNHLTVYAAPVAHKLAKEWRPLRASTIARPIGEFSIITRADDHSLQWGYKGEALYTFTGDYSPGEVNGICTGDAAIHAALAMRNFTPPGIEVRTSPGRGPIMTNGKGLSLYYVSRYQLQYGARETRDGHAITYNDAKALGTAACVGECTNSWKPFLATAKDQGWGFWEVIDRTDGTKQWAFKGSPVYAFAGDKKPGDLEGNNRYVIVYGDAKGGYIYSNPGSDPRESSASQPQLGAVEMNTAVYGGGVVGRDQRPGREQAGAGFYWHTVGLFY